VDRVVEIAVGRGDDADVHLDGLRAAQPFDNALLQHTQQLDLYLHRELTDLVKEERRLIGGLETTDLAGQRARICAALTAEQLAFDERGRNGCTAHPDHLAAVPRAEVVYRSGNHLFAGARLTEEEHGGRSGGHLFDLFEDPPDRGALRDDIARLAQNLDFASELDVFLRELITQLPDLLEGLVQRNFVGRAHEGLGDDPSDQTKAFDDDRRPLVRLCGAQRERAELPRILLVHRERNDGG